MTKRVPNLAGNRTIESTKYQCDSDHIYAALRSDGHRNHETLFRGAQRITLHKDGALNFIIGDHFGSSSLMTDAGGNELASMRHTAWGEVRYESGASPTDYTYTGQYSYTYINLLWYNSRRNRTKSASIFKSKRFLFEKTYNWRSRRAKIPTLLRWNRTTSARHTKVRSFDNFGLSKKT